MIQDMENLFWRIPYPVFHSIGKCHFVTVRGADLLYSPLIEAGVFSNEIKLMAALGSTAMAVAVVTIFLGVAAVAAVSVFVGVMAAHGIRIVYKLSI